MLGKVKHNFNDKSFSYEICSTDICIEVHSDNTLIECREKQLDTCRY